MRAKVKATKARTSRSKNETTEPSSGNVFADLGFQDAEERLLKAKLATKIAQLIEKKGWTQAQTAPAYDFGPTQGLAPPALPAFRLFSRSLVFDPKPLGPQD